MKRYPCALAVALLPALAAPADFRGGVFLTDDSWNAAATAAIGQAATVTRLYIAFDDPENTLLTMFAGTDSVRTRNGLQLYQDPFGGDSSQNINPAVFPAVPSSEWDSYVSVGPITAPSTTSANPDLEFVSDGVDGSWSGVPENKGLPTIYPGHAGGPNGMQDPDTGLWLIFAGQFTILGDVDEVTSVPNLTGDPTIVSNIFTGTFASIDWIDSEANRFLTFSQDIEIVPSPSAALLLAGGLGAFRRRR